jgi:hypothetical protein
MMDTNINQGNQTVYETTTPRFDAVASANAQPVQPIRVTRSSRLANRLSSLRGHFSRQSRVLAAVVVIGLITGALAGILMVNLFRSGPPAAVDEASASQVSEIPPADTKTLDTFAAELGNADLVATPPGNRNRRTRRGNGNRPRAYRVAVLR